MTRLPAAVLAIVLTAAAACSSAARPDSEVAATDTTRPTATATPSTAASESTPPAAAGPVRLRVTKVVSGLDHPWDVHPIGNGRLLVTERAGHLPVVQQGQGRRA